MPFCVSYKKKGPFAPPLELISATERPPTTRPRGAQVVLEKRQTRGEAVACGDGHARRPCAGLRAAARSCGLMWLGFFFAENF
ncbi:hypothetical protein V6Z11_D11G109500 [Gossypium hirsutum]